MSDRASFDPTLSTAKDRMRLLLGDTDVQRAKAVDADVMALPVDDAVYLGILAGQSQDERRATIALADALVVKHSQQETKASIDGVESAEWGNLLAGWREVASRLRAEIAAEAAAETARQRAGFRVLRPTRGGEQGGEYHAGGRRGGTWED